VGTYTINNSILDIYILIGMGILGYILRKMKFDMAPLILALVLGPMMEKSLRQSLFMSRGDLWLFASRPLTAVLLSIALAGIVVPILFRLRRKRLPRPVSRSGAGTL
jgi:putative tricarboxylic transport membrane protein